MRHELTSKTHVGLTCLALFGAALFLTAYSSKNPAVARVGSSVVIEIVSPVSLAADSARRGLMGAWGHYVLLVGTARRNQELEARVSELERRLASSLEFERENQRLKALLHVAATNHVEGIAARVIGGDSSGWVRGIMVDQGTSSGVREGMPVIHSQGVVGQVVSVGSNSSRVLLVSDHASGVDVLHENSRARGVVEGAGEQICELKFITKDVQAREGDAIITSGMDTVYPKGILVGRISGVGQSTNSLFQTIEVKPAVDFSKLEEVLIVPTSATVEGESLSRPVPRGVR